ncbi:hypothetical protein O6H91_Y471400 [Diphasiastrum complanatum]|nr:hypothetical protein O6H91_Y471400 [Diphasiastrum complanatum]KAJ7216855.1 hypothetical protein O6H91_Y471400 [Diphasiastrum complanatum]KAJ7216857.1 hypothetical protein O6H91_Y471400 [Diphasiastrum complanatum]
MQTQAQVAGQACIPQQNGNSLQGSSMGGWRKTWQTDADLSIRRVILENIFRLFQKRKPQVTPEWQQKLPDFVKRLEEQLYRDAASKEEYDNLHTLEQRLQSVAKRLTPKNNQTISHHSQGSSLSVSNMIPTPGIGSNIVPVPGSSSNMIPTPGGSNMIPTPGVGSNMVPTPGSRASIMPVNGGGMMPTPGHASTMIPTPGNLSSMIPTPGAVSNLMPASGHGSIFSTTGLTMVSMPSTTGNPLISQQGMTGMHMLQNSQLASSMALPALGSQMIPTPGLTASQMTANVSAVSGPQLQQPQFGVGSGPHIYRNMNGQTNGFVSNNGQRRTSLGGGNGGVMQLMANGQQLVNGNAMHSSASYLNATPYGNLQMQSQQRMNLQRQQHMRMQGDGYAMNAADLAGPANLSSTATSGSVAASSLGMNPIALQASKMIPVPGLPTQQQTLQPQSQVQPPQQVQHLQRNNFSSSPLVGRSQQQAAQVSKHTLSQSPVSSNFSGQKQPNAASQTEQQLPFNNGFSVVEQQQMHRQQPAQQKLVDIQQQRTSQPQGSQLELETVNRQGQIHQQLQSSQFPSTLLQQHPQKDSVQFKQQQQQPYSQPQPPQDVISQEQQEDAQQLKDQQFQQSEKLPLLDSQQLQEQLCDSPGTGSQSVPQSQSLNQSALNDPVEVVQAPSRLGAASAGGLASEQLGTTTDQQRMQQYQKQQRWLLFLRHASKCTAPEGQCQTTPHCHMAKQLWSHIAVCCERVCQYSRCTASRTLLHHHRQCREPRCPVCGPVRLIIVQQRAHASQNQQGQGTSAITTQLVAGASGAASSSAGISSFGMSQAIAVPKDEFVLSREAQGQPPTKRAKVEPAATSQQHMQVPQIVTTKVQASLQPAIQSTTILQTMNRPCVGSKSDLQGTVKKEGDGLDTHVARVDSQSRSQSGSTAERPVQPSQVQVKMELGIVQDPVSTNIKSEPHDSGVMTTPSKVKQEPGLTTSATTVPSMTSKSGKPKFGGTSLTELFTPEQIKEHIMGLRQWFGQSRAKAEKNQAMEHQMSESACHLCAVEKLTFEPPPIYCTPCGARIKRNALFYTTGLGETRHYFCIPCYNEIRSDMVEMDGQTYPKTRLEKRKNDEETEEAWVQCDKCNLWQHQVCALFNGRRNEGGEAEYTCPQCCMKEMEKGERKPLPPSAVLGARDLPKTFLSDHLEQRLARKLKNERLERARVQGKTFEEIPGAEALVVRVVSSVDKKLEVKQRFMEIFQEEDYPSEFPYKSKVVLLFQRIEGVEVCLFGMYVQEFGTECSQPNQRRVYLSYLDSVKYFRPDVRTVHGEALRTFVYHEILIGYLDYCKKRGFSSCYIWACPPLKGEDYILYCHPEIQKTPKSDKLREWYLTMLRKATTDGIVVEVTNLYDHFFVSAGECKAKVTAARLPYFDGDYWPGAAEDMIVQLQQEAEDGRRLQKKGSKKAAPKRACKLITQAEVSSNASKDLQLMHKLGDSILPMKEDFIMVHMHHACSHCCVFIVTGCRWVCKQCKNFQLCDRCYDVEQKLEEKDRHPVSSKEAHHLIPIEVNDVTPDTKDKDEIIESEFFDTRQAFLSLCQGNHYQYDTLRRAKHSSMMVLYHLHNPTAPAFVTTCNVCHHDIETGQGWRCETCPDFDVCNACYQKDEVKKHPHKLTPHPSAAERNAQNKEARQKRVLQLRKMLDLLVHASQCCAPQCQYPKCRSVKGTIPSWYYVSDTGIWRLCNVQKNVASLAITCKGLQRIGMPGTTLQGSEGALETTSTTK